MRTMLCRRPRSAGFLAVLAVAAAPAGLRAQALRQGHDPPPMKVVLGEWPKYCGTLAMTGVSAGEHLLTRNTAASLKPLFAVPLGGPVASSPSVSRGVVYVGDWSGREWALDAATGAVRASADLGTTSAPQCAPSTLGITSAPAIEGDTLYVAGGDDAFYALDATTMAVRWKKALGDNSGAGGYYGWCSPAVVEGRILQGIASNCDTPLIPGKLLALDAATGGSVTAAAFVPETVVGGGVWTSPAVDLAHRTVFVTTGSALNVADGDAFSIVRLSLDSLAILDSWKIELDGDVTWDADWGSSPTLFTAPGGPELVGAGQKDGNYYAFLRDGLSAGPLWRATIAQGGAVPQGGDGTLSTAAFDGARLYVGGGVPPDGTSEPGAMGSVVALDPFDGSVLWRRAFPGPVIAPVSSANGVVLAVGGKAAYALDAETGDVLWSFQTAAPCYGGIAISKGRIYFGDLSGTLYAFGVQRQPE